MPRSSESLVVPSYLCNASDRLSLTGMAALFQEAAWKSAERLGFAFVDEASPVFWVLSRLTVEVTEMPRWNEAITITTWPSGTQRIFATREYHITAGDQTKIKAGSAWIVVDAATGRPARPERHLDLELAHREHVVAYDSTRLQPLQTCDGEWERVQPAAIDRNGHVNNTRYFDWFANWARSTAFDPFVMDASASSFVVAFTANTTLDHEYRVCGDHAEGQVEARIREGAGSDESVAWTLRIRGS